MKEIMKKEKRVIERLRRMIEIMKVENAEARRNGLKGVGGRMSEDERKLQSNLCESSLVSGIYLPLKI